MPVILKQNQHKFEIKKDLIIPNKVLKKTVTSEKVEQEEGDGIFSSLGMLAKSATKPVDHQITHIKNTFNS
jgi:hypothetical protein